MIDPALAEELVEILKQGGADFAEVYAQESASLSLSAASGAPASVEREVDGGVGFRVEKAGRQLFSAVSGHHPASLKAAARALASGSPDPDAGGASSQGTSRGLEAGDPSALEILLAAGESAARGADERVVGYSGIASASVIETLRHDSEGRRMARSERRVTLYQRVLAREEGRGRQAARTLRAECGVPSEEGAADQAASAARNAALALEAQPSPEGTFPVVLAPQAGGLLFHETLGRLLEADAVAGGSSPYAGLLGHSIGSSALSLRQVPPPGAPLDDEGYPVVEVALVEGGVLRSLLTDRAYALRMGVLRTGNGRRESFRTPPCPRTSHLALSAGEGSLQTLLQEMEMGIYVTWLGAGEVDGVEGRYRFPAVEAFLVREGLVAEPLAELVLAGECLDLPRRVSRTGQRTEVHPGLSRKGGQGVPVWDEAPALLLEGIQVRRGG